MWPFDVACPMDVVFLTENGQQKVRMNRRAYFPMAEIVRAHNFSSSAFPGGLPQSGGRK